MRNITQYKISIRPQDLVVGQNYIVDKRETVAPLRKGGGAPETWYQFRIPVREYQKRMGGISDFTSIRFMRMFLTNFEKPIVLRFGTFDLVRGEWRQYQQKPYQFSINIGHNVCWRSKHRGK